MLCCGLLYSSPRGEKPDTVMKLSPKSRGLFDKFGRPTFLLHLYTVKRFGNDNDYVVKFEKKQSIEENFIKNLKNDLTNKIILSLQ